MVSQYTLRRVLIELYNVSPQEYELEIIEKLFEEGLNSIIELTSLIISWYLYFRKNDLKLDLDGINMNDFVEIDCCKIKLKPIDFEVYVKEKWSVEAKSEDIEEILKDFKTKNISNKLIRGKNLMWYFVNFINCFCKKCDQIIPSMQVPIAGCRELNIKDAIKDLGQRTRIPQSLKEFLDRTCLTFVREIENEIA